MQSTASKLFSWCTNNHINFNPGKCHIRLSTKNTIDVHLEGTCIRLARVNSFLESQYILILSLIDMFLTYAMKFAKQ